MAETASDFLVQRLYDWGVRRIFGYPGDGINGLMGALNRHSEKIRFIQSRHEELAAFMACAHAKFTGEVGVCMATSGPGAIHLLNGLYDAKKDNMPVVAIVGQQPTFAMGTNFQQEVDLISLFKDVAGDYIQMASTPKQVRHLVDQSMRIAKAKRAVTCIILPNNIQEEDAVTSMPRKHGANYSSVGYREPNVVPREQDLDEAAAVLNEGKKVAILVGAGALQASAQVREMAQALGAGVAKALLGKAAISDKLSYCTGAIGLLGTRPSWDMMMNCDTLLLVGTNFPYGEFLPKDGQAKAVQIDIKPEHLGLRYPATVPLHGDSRLTLEALLPRLERKADRDWQHGIEDGIKSWHEVVAERAQIEANPVNPQRVFHELSPKLPRDCIITCDSGSSANWFARDLAVEESMMASLSGGLATMLPAVPYATAAKFSHPERPVIAFVGDGAMQMLGNCGLITIAAHWHEWRDPRLIVCVLNNMDLNQVTWEQRVMAGDPKFSASQDVPRFSYARYAEELGLKGMTVDAPGSIASAWDDALAADRPVVFDAIVDPDVPPIPPHITFKQAQAYMNSMIQGDPDTLAMGRLSFKEVMESWFHVGR